MIKNYSLKDAFRALDDLNEELIETSIVYEGPLTEGFVEDFGSEKEPHHNIKVTKISWDTDGEDIDLPSEMFLDLSQEEIDETDDTIKEIILNKLSDETGWLVKSFEFEKVEPKKESIEESKEPLKEENFSLSDEEGLKEIEEFKEEDENELPEIKIVDTNADEIDEVASNEEVAGSFVFTCDKCGESIFRTLDELKDAGYERLDDTEKSQFKLKNKNISDGEFYRCTKCGGEIWNGDKQIVLADVDKEVKGEEEIVPQPDEEINVLPEREENIEETKVSDDEFALESLQKEENKELTEELDESINPAIDEYFKNFEKNENDECLISDEDIDRVNDEIKDFGFEAVVTKEDEKGKWYSLSYIEDSERPLDEENLEEVLKKETVEKFLAHDFFKQFNAANLKTFIDIYLDFIGDNSKKDNDVTPEELYDFMTEEGIGLFALDNYDKLKFGLFKELCSLDDKLMKVFDNQYVKMGDENPEDEKRYDIIKMYLQDDSDGTVADKLAEIKKEYIEIDESLKEPEEEYDEVSITDIKEESIDKAISEKMSELYENFGSYKTTTAFLKDVENKIILEGKLTFTSNKEQNVKFILEAIESDNGSIKFKLTCEDFADFNSELTTTLNEGLLEAKIDFTDKEEFINNGKNLNDTLSFESETGLSFEEYLDKFGEEDQKNHRDWIEELYQDYQNLTEASSAEKRALKNGEQDETDLIQGKAIARIKDPKAREAAVAAIKAGRPEVAADFYGSRKAAQADASVAKKIDSIQKASVSEDYEKGPEECESLEEYADDQDIDELRYHISDNEVLSPENISEDDERDYSGDADGYIVSVCSHKLWGAPTSNPDEERLILDYVIREYPTKVKVLRKYLGNENSSVKLDTYVVLEDK